jgi:hypothetical protein
MPDDYLPERFRRPYIRLILGDLEDCSELLVPKKGLEPPHPCEYVDLNHARLPIPPLRHDRRSADSAEQAADLSLANGESGVKYVGSSATPTKAATWNRTAPAPPIKKHPAPGTNRDAPK